MKDDSIQTMITRHGLPPRMKALVDTMAAAGFDVSDAPDEGKREVAKVQMLVDGPRLIAAILATFLAQYEPSTEAEPEQLVTGAEGDEETDDERVERETREAREAREARGEEQQDKPEGPEGDDPPLDPPPPVDGAAFDHDKNGKVGGSKPKAKPAAKPKAKPAAT